jgi:phosphotransferase system  glucose/maltose/N-acetylglucosamine-specific IIC component
MKRIGIVFLGIGFGIICYILFTLFFSQKEIVSPLEESEVNKVIRQNNK